MELPVARVTTFEGPEFNIETVKNLVTKWTTSSDIWRIWINHDGFRFINHRETSWQRCMTEYEMINTIFEFINYTDDVEVDCQSDCMEGKMGREAENPEIWTALLILLMSSACKLEKVKKIKIPEIKWVVPLKVHTLKLVDWIMFARFSGEDIFLGGGPC